MTPCTSPLSNKAMFEFLYDRLRLVFISGAHFPFPGAGVFAKDGNAYTFTPTVQS